MSAKSTKGSNVAISKPVPSKEGVVIESISVGSNGSIEVTLPSTATVDVGAVITFGSVGYSSLNGKSLVAVNVENDGSGNLTVYFGDVALGAGAISANPICSITPFADLTCFCLSGIQINAESPSTISVGTFCDPSASIPSIAKSAGTITFNGFVDVTTPDYREILKADEDALERSIVISLPSNGYLLLKVIVSQVTYDLPLDGAIGFTGTASLTTKPVHFFKG